MILDIEATEVFSKNFEAFENEDTKIIINQGGSRSSKTYSILQCLILIALKRPKTKISIIRKSFPSLRGSVYRDWKEIMLQWNIYWDNQHSKTEHIYHFDNGSTIEFFSLDDSQKVRGRKHTILYINEANEIDFESWMQLKMRCEGKVFLDYNPSELEHWSYNLINDRGSILIKSTYLDNPFLSGDQKEYIENLIKVDPDFYKIYALGERVAPRSLVYNHFVRYDNLPPQSEITGGALGFDIGFAGESALVEVDFATGNRLYVKEHFYLSGKTGEELISMIERTPFDRGRTIYTDSARPDIILQLRRRGFRAMSSDKRVKEGIDFIRSKQVFININSENIWRESKLYSWKELRDGTITDEIVKKADHALDSLRYAAFTFGGKPQNGVPFIIRK